jgi:hypothetical protein
MTRQDFFCPSRFIFRSSDLLPHCVEATSENSKLLSSLNCKENGSRPIEIMPVISNKDEKLSKENHKASCQFRAWENGITLAVWLLTEWSSDEYVDIDLCRAENSPDESSPFRLRLLCVSMVPDSYEPEGELRQNGFCLQNSISMSTSPL